jgi:hypothetical protein
MRHDFPFASVMAANAGCTPVPRHLYAVSPIVKREYVTTDQASTEIYGIDVVGLTPGGVDQLSAGAPRVDVSRDPELRSGGATRLFVAGRFGDAPALLSGCRDFSVAAPGTA